MPRTIIHPRPSPQDQETKIMPIIPSEETMPHVIDPIEPTVAENSPAYTLPQKIATLIGGIPILANLTSAFGIWTPSAKQLDALQESANYGWKVALSLVGADALVRLGRNFREGKKATANATIVSAQHYAAAQEAVTVPQYIVNPDKDA
jgi:hypothetical protein